MAPCVPKWREIDGRDDRNLLYQFINNWDTQTNYLCSQYSRDGTHFSHLLGIQVNGFEYITLCDERNHIIAYEKGSLLFVFNLNRSSSYEGYRVPVRNEGVYRCILSVFHFVGGDS